MSDAIEVLEAFLQWFPDPAPPKVIEARAALATLKAREDARRLAVGALEWINLKGGLGQDVHNSIDAALAANAAAEAGGGPNVSD